MNHEIIMEKLFQKLDSYMHVIQLLSNGINNEDIVKLEAISAAEFTDFKTIMIGTQRAKWKGSLKEFAELIIELENKGWMEPIAHGELNAFIRALLICFDFSETQKRVDSNTENSLMQYLKPSERDSKIFSKRYVKKFVTILSNKLKK